MQTVSVVFASRKGQTRRIAEYMEWVLTDKVRDVQFVDLSSFGRHELAPDTDAVIVGGPVYIGRFPRKLIRWIRRHHAALHAKPSAFFSVSLNAADKREESRHIDDTLLQEFIEASGWVPNFVASFAGAIKYREYSYPIRRLMVNRSAAANGPTDTDYDYEFTDWKMIDRFLDDFIEQRETSPFATANRLAKEVSVNRFMPEFDHAWSLEKEIDTPPAEVYEALRSMNPGDMRLAKLLGRVRNLGRRPAGPSNDTFGAAAERFGNVVLVDQPPRQLVVGLIGQFWKPDFGVRRVAANEFARFDEPGYVKVLTSFRIDPLNDGERSCLRSELRTFATSVDAARKFNVYWALLNPGIRLYMRSMLNALDREASALAA